MTNPERMSITPDNDSWEYKAWMALVHAGQELRVMTDTEFEAAMEELELLRPISDEPDED